ncbi:unnamed protein product [Gongylonema pulchrum]|uniref:BTB_2 domain-containing protein n=1 Tax=Gongylonema pulchrum TaxID=637853 RepID=A0A183E6H4_9BILA|nr:unnamed protein product [Gongylonema pulchrum]
MAARCRRRRAVFDDAIAPATALGRQDVAQGSATRGPDGGRRSGAAAISQEGTGSSGSQEAAAHSAICLKVVTVGGDGELWFFNGLRMFRRTKLLFDLYGFDGVEGDEASEPGITVFIASTGCSRAGPMIDEVDEQGFGYEQPPRTCDLLDMEWRRGGGQFGVR